MAIVMDLYSGRIIGWASDKRMTTGLISREFIMAYNLDRLYCSNNDFSPIESELVN